jgi:hypothetical protein
MQQFFGVSNAKWKKKKDHLLLHLSHYYEYEINHSEKDRRKLEYHIIKKIKDYEPPLGKKAMQNKIYSDKIIEVIELDNVQTAKNVSRIIKDDDAIKALTHAEGTIYEYTRVNMRALFGKGILEGGTTGVITEKIWCKSDLAHNVYIPMSQEQIEFLYGTFYSYKKATREEELSIFADYDSGLITKEEMTKLVSDSGLHCFLEAKNAFKAKFGFFPIKVQVYELSAYPSIPEGDFDF